MAPATVVGVPVNAPVVVLNVIPAGAAGEIAKLVIAPPVELTLNPAAWLLAARDSEAEESVKAGTPTGARGVVIAPLTLEVADTPSALTAVMVKEY